MNYKHTTYCYNKISGTKFPVGAATTITGSSGEKPFADQQTDKFLALIQNGLITVQQLEEWKKKLEAEITRRKYNQTFGSSSSHGVL